MKYPKTSFMSFVLMSRRRKFALIFWTLFVVLAEVYAHQEYALGAIIILHLLKLLPLAIGISWVGLYRNYITTGQDGLL